MDGSVALRQMAFANARAVISTLFQVEAERIRLGPREKVVFEIHPRIANAGTESGRLFIAAVHHAVFATGIARHTIHDTVFFPSHFREHVLIARVMPIGHYVAGGFPAAHVVSRDSPRHARELAFAGEKFLIAGGTEQG